MDTTLQSFKGEINLKIHQNNTNCNDEMKYRKQIINFHFQEDHFGKNGAVKGKLFSEILLTMKFLHTKLQVKCMNIISYSLKNKANKSRNEIEEVEEESITEISEFLQGAER